VHHPVPSRRDQFGGTQDQIMILRAVEVGAKPADLTDDPAPQCRQMAGVHRRPEPLGRPIRFQEMSRLAPVGQHMSLVAVDVVDVGGGVDGGRRSLERSRYQPVVVIQQGNELTTGHRQRIVRRRDNSTVGGAVHDAYSWVTSGQIVEHRTYLGPGRAIVDKTPFPVAERLRQDAVDAREECPQRRIVDRSDDRESGSDGRGC
jgi:hypothetical protein